MTRWERVEMGICGEGVRDMGGFIVVEIWHEKVGSR